VSIVLKLPEITKSSEKYNLIIYPDGTKILYQPKPDQEGFETALEPLYPTFRELVRRFFLSLSNKGWRYVITNTIRTKEQAEKLYKKNPQVAVQTSPHEFGVAVDFYVADDRGRNILRTEPVLKHIDEHCRALGLYWGNWFKTHAKEPWHIQVAADWKGWYKKNVMEKRV